MSPLLITQQAPRTHSIFYTVLVNIITILYTSHFTVTPYYGQLILYNVHTREVLMGVGDGVASVIMLTFTRRPGPHADFYKEARPPC